MASPSKLPQKRKQPESNNVLLKLSADERKLYDLIESRKGVGIWTADMKKVTNLSQAVVTKALKTLEKKNLIKNVVNIHNKAKKFYMASKYEPSDEISGGSWYDKEGKFDVVYIKTVSDQCLAYLDKVKAAILEDIWESVKGFEVDGTKIFTQEPTMKEVSEILDKLVLDNVVEKVKSSGTGVFSRVPSGKVCYRRVKKVENVEKEASSVSSIPCGVCPRISECTPDGVISPVNCVYFNKWMGMDF